jgi:hypothetical protein
MQFSETFTRVSSRVHFVDIKPALKCCILIDQNLEMESDIFYFDIWFMGFRVFLICSNIG